MKAKRKTVDGQLADWRACEEGVAWAKGKMPKVAWETCPRGDWLIWAAGKAGISPMLLVKAIIPAARRSLVHVPAGEDRPRLAIEAAERCLEHPTPENRSAAYAAASAAYAAWSAADAAGASEHARCADDVRALISWSMILAAMKNAKA